MILKCLSSLDGISNEMGGNLDDIQGNFCHPDKVPSSFYQFTGVVYFVCGKRKKKEGSDGVVG